MANVYACDDFELIALYHVYSVRRRGDFLCEVHIRGKAVPPTWPEAVKMLQKTMIIRS